MLIRNDKDIVGDYVFSSFKSKSILIVWKIITKDIGNYTIYTLVGYLIIHPIFINNSIKISFT